MMPTPPRNRNDFQVAIFCALPLEAENVQSVFDVCWEDYDKQYGKAPGDQNAYSTGVIGKCNVVLVHMPRMGGNNAALAAAGLRSSFQSIQLALVVGICGVVPVHPTTGQEVYLGDVVISTAVIQYDFGRQYPNGFQTKTGIEDTLGPANPEIRSFTSKLATRQNLQRFNRKFGQFLSSHKPEDGSRPVAYPGVANDRLYEASYLHQHYPDTTCHKCLPDVGTCTKDCNELGCENSKLVPRKRHAHTMHQAADTESYVPSIHLGRFGSANTVMKSGLDRNRISEADSIVAFEMEGAGVWAQYPTVIIKAACDYSDSHKNKKWQPYAAAMAAACLKAFLEDWDIIEPRDEDGLSDPVWHVPDYVPGFVGRNETLEKLQQLIRGSDNLRTVSLLGLGGVGKSRLSLELAYKIKSEHPKCSIFWIQASNQLTFERDILAIGKKLGITGIEDEKADVKQLVKQRLSLSNTNRWLLILDNADDEVLWGTRPTLDRGNTSLVGYLPKSKNGSILVTTRTRLVASFLAEKQVVELQAMIQADATKLFMSKLEDSTSIQRQDLLPQLTDKLANLPLAIVQAASYINITQISIQTYLDLLDQPEAEVIQLLSKDFGDSSRYPDAINPVVTTWLLSFEHIRQNHPLAANFLSAIACLHEKGIPLSLLPEIASKLDTVDAIAVLAGYSFLTKQSHTIDQTSQEELYDIHRLVHLAARNWLKSNATFSEWVKTCLKRMVEVFPSPIYMYKSLWTIYMPHAKHICEEMAERDCSEHYELLELMAQCFTVDGKYHDAVGVLTAVAEWRKHTLGGLDYDTLRTYCDLGISLCLNGDLPAAEHCLRTTNDNIIANLGPEHPLMLENKRYLAQVLIYLGKYTEAEQMSRTTLQLSESLYGKDSPEVILDLSSLAQALSEQGKHTEAEKLFRDILSLVETLTGRDSPDTLTTMNNLAFALGKQGKYTQAEHIHRDALRSRQSIFGNEHPDTLTSMNNLADMLGKQGKNTEAEKLNRETLRLRKALLGESHPHTLLTMNNLAWNLKDQNQTEEAIQLMRSCVDLRVAVLGEAHPDTQLSINALKEWTTRRIPGSWID